MSKKTKFEYSKLVSISVDEYVEGLQQMIADDYHPYDSDFSEEKYNEQYELALSESIEKLKSTLDEVKKLRS